MSQTEWSRPIMFIMNHNQVLEARLGKSLPGIAVPVTTGLSFLTGPGIDLIFFCSSHSARILPFASHAMSIGDYFSCFLMFFYDKKYFNFRIRRFFRKEYSKFTMNLNLFHLKCFLFPFKCFSDCEVFVKVGYILEKFVK